MTDNLNPHQKLDEVELPPSNRDVNTAQKSLQENEPVNVQDVQVDVENKPAEQQPEKMGGEQAPPEVEAAPEKKSNVVPIVIGVVVLLVIIVGVGMTIMMGGGQPELPCDYKTQVFEVHQNYFQLTDVLEKKTISGKVRSNFLGRFGGIKDGKEQWTPMTEEDYMGNITVVHGQYKDGYKYDFDGKYTDEDFEIEKMTTYRKYGKKFECFRVSKVEKPAEEFSAVKNIMAYNFSQGETGVYRYYKGKLTRIQQLSLHYYKNGWVALDVEIDSKKLPSDTICFVHGNVPPPNLESKDDAQYAQIFQRKEEKWQMDINYKQYENLPDGSKPRSPLDFTETPTDWSNTYGDNKHFHYVGKHADKHLMVAWQDQKSNKAYVTMLMEFTQKSTQLTIDQGVKFGCAGQGEDGEFFYITFSELADKTVKTSSLDVWLYSAKYDGTVIKKNKIDSSKDNGLAIWNFNSNDDCNLVYDPKKPVVGLHLSRTYPMTPDGLNHQAAGVIFFHPKTLEVWQDNLNTAMQTASHSFGSNMFVGTDGMFTGIEMGDQYPRGVSIWKTDEKLKLNSKTVYGVKVKHGEKANPFGNKEFEPYPEASTGETQFYKWSNDNQVYSELGSRGVYEYDDGYVVFFLSERPALDNSKALDPLNAPRNVGFVKISKDLKTILSKGPKETGGWYNFGGKWTDFSHEGIQWLTNYQEKDKTLSRLKTMQIGSKYILLLFEVWDSAEKHDGDQYRYTAYKIVDKDGNDYGDGKVCEICYTLRFMRTDAPIQTGENEATIVQGTEDGKIASYTISVKGLE